MRSKQKRGGIRWTTVLGVALMLWLCALTPVRSVEAQPAAMARSGPRDVPPSAVSGFILKYRDVAATTSASKATKNLSLPVAAVLKKGRQLSLNSFAARNGITLSATSLNTLGHLKISASRMMSRTEADKLARALLDSSPEIEWAVPDVQVPLAAIPNDTYWTGQWALQSTPAGINMPGAWDLYAIRRSASDPNLPIVAIVDSGYRRQQLHATERANVEVGRLRVSKPPYYRQCVFCRSAENAQNHDEY